MKVSTSCVKILSPWLGIPTSDLERASAIIRFLPGVWKTGITLAPEHFPGFVQVRVKHMSLNRHSHSV